MFNSLAQAIAFNTAQAGADFLWNSATVSNSRPRSDAFPGLRAWLIEAQAGVCAACGDMLDGEIEVCHVVAARDAVKYARTGNDVDASGHRGYVAGNLYAGHRGCNVKDGKIGPVVPVAGFICPELVALTYPSRADMLRAIARQDDALVQESRDARRERQIREAMEEA